MVEDGGSTAGIRHRLRSARTGQNSNGGQVRGSHDGVRATARLVVAVAVVLVVGSLAGPVGVVLLLGIAGALGAYAWLFGHRTALRALQAYPVGEAQQPTMYRLVRELATAARQPVPRLYVSPTAAPNSFTTGREPRRATICCTEGLLKQLDERELRAVLAQQLAHIRHRGSLAPSVTAALATVALIPAQLAWRSSERPDDDGGGPLGRALVILLSPIAAGVLRLGVSRSRAYHADAAGAALGGDVLALAAALRTLDAGSRAFPLRPEPRLRAMSALMIVDPFRPGFVTRLLGTHPPTPERVTRLEALAGYRR